MPQNPVNKVYLTVDGRWSAPNTNLSGHSDLGARFPSPGFQSAELSRHLQCLQSVCILIRDSSPSRRISLGDANLTLLRLNQLLRESESRGCGAWRGNHKNLMQDFRQICASRHVLVRVLL